MTETNEVTASTNDEKTVAALVYSPQQMSGEPIATIHLPPDASIGLITELVQHVRRADGVLDLKPASEKDDSHYIWYGDEDRDRRIVILYNSNVAYIVDFGIGLAPQQVYNISRLAECPDLKQHDCYVHPLQKSRAEQGLLEPAAASIMQAWHEKQEQQPHPYWALRVETIERTPASDDSDEDDSVINHINVYSNFTGFIDAQILFHLAGPGVRLVGEDRQPCPAVLVHTNPRKPTYVSWEHPNMPDELFKMLNECVNPSATTGKPHWLRDGMPDDQIKDLAKRLYRGDIITSLQVPKDQIHSVFMVTIFMNREYLLALGNWGASTIYGDTTQSTMSVNGYPMCWNAGYLNRADTKKMLDYYEKIKAALD